MEFIITLLQNVQENKTASLSEIASETYYSTLQRYHGWIVTGTFTVVLKFVPSREAFMETILLESEESTSPSYLSEAGTHKERIHKEQMEARLDASMSAFCSKFQNLLQEIHTFLDSKGLDDPTKVWFLIVFIPRHRPDNRCVLSLTLFILFLLKTASYCYSDTNCLFLRRGRGTIMFHHSKDESSDFLPNLTQAFKSIDVNNSIVTKDFVEACARGEPIFDHIGTVILVRLEPTTRIVHVVVLWCDMKWIDDSNVSSRGE